MRRENMETTTKWNRSSIRGTIYALVAAIGFGALVPAMKALLQGLTPLQVSSFVLVGAAIGAGVAWTATRSRADRAARASYANSTGRDTRDPQDGQRPKTTRIVLIAALNAGWMTCLAFGVSAASAANASLLMGCAVAAATVCAWVSRRRSFCYKACAAVALICVSAIVLLWDGTAQGAFVPGALLVIAACVMIAVENSLEQTVARDDAPKVLTVKSLIAAAALLAVSLTVDGASDFATAPIAPMASALVVGLASCGLSSVLLLAAQHDLGEARASSCFSLAPFVALVISWSTYGLVLDPLLFGSLALMALGVWLDVDDGIFHERAYSEFDRELVELYANEVSAFSLDRMHRRSSHPMEGD